MIPQKYKKTVFSFFMALLMSGFMSFVVTAHNIGFVEDIISIWLKSWRFAFIIAFPTVLLVSPLVERLVNLVMKEE